MAFTETPWRGSWKGVLGVGRRLVLRRQRTEQALSRAVATSELVHFAPNPAGPFRLAWYQARPGRPARGRAGGTGGRQAAQEATAAPGRGLDQGASGGGSTRMDPSGLGGCAPGLGAA